MIRALMLGAALILPTLGRTDKDFQAGGKVGVGLTLATDNFGGLAGISYGLKGTQGADDFHYSCIVFLNPHAAEAAQRTGGCVLAEAVVHLHQGDARHAHVVLAGDVELHNFYIPAGGDIPDPDSNVKFAHKLQFLDELKDHFAAGAKAGASAKGKAIMVGDLNIAPLEDDVWSHKQLLSVVSHTPIEVEKLNAVQKAGKWVDAVRQITPAPTG